MNNYENGNGTNGYADLGEIRLLNAGTEAPMLEIKGSLIFI